MNKNETSTSILLLPLRFSNLARINCEPYCDMNNPVFIQTHENNCFNNTGEAIINTGLLRGVYGYPKTDEVRYFFSVDKKGRPLFIQQAYQPPNGNRVSDKIEVFEITVKPREYDQIFLQQLSSDLIFGTKSAKIPHNMDIAFKTWIIFTKAIAICENYKACNFFFHIQQEPKEEINSACKDLNYESLRRASYIFSQMTNTSNNRTKALKLAKIDFSSPNIPFSFDEIVFALKCCSSENENNRYIKEGYIYLYENGYNYNALKNIPALKDYFLEKYLNKLYNYDLQNIAHIRSLINNTTYSYEKLISHLDIIKKIIDSNNSEIEYELIFILNRFDIYEPTLSEIQKYVKDFLKNLRYNQSIRHNFLDYLDNNPDYTLRIKNFEEYEDEINMINKKYNNYYINDLYYLTLINLSKSNRDIKYLTDLVLFDYKNGNYNRISLFYKNISFYLKTKVNHRLKKAILVEINIKIRKHIYELLSSIKHKYSTILKISRL